MNPKQPRYPPDMLTTTKVRDHYELIDPDGKTVLSADSLSELENELEQLKETFEKENE